MSIINWAIGIQNVTGIEGSGNLFGEKHWLTIALDVLALHSTGVFHDNWVEARNLSMGPEFFGTMFPSAFAGRSIAGSNSMNPYGYRAGQGGWYVR